VLAQVLAPVLVVCDGGPALGRLVLQAKRVLVRGEAFARELRRSRIEAGARRRLSFHCLLEVLAMRPDEAQGAEPRRVQDTSGGGATVCPAPAAERVLRMMRRSRFEMTTGRGHGWPPLPNEDDD